MFVERACQTQSNTATLVTGDGHVSNVREAPRRRASAINPKRRISVKSPSSLSKRKPFASHRHCAGRILFKEI